ncbi:MAG: hypothetical protein JWQ66_2111 [Mucilaginibacter sp.]|nr:hypothetical protein [Mucilaginibacter sp.]
MEAVSNNYNITSALPLEKVMSTFFKDNTPDSVKVLFWKMFQCWVTRDCNIKSDLTDEEIALFFDQLIDLVAAAHILHQANRALDAGQEGSVSE